MTTHHYDEMHICTSICATQHNNSTHSTTKKCTCVQHNTTTQRTPLQRNVHVCNTTQQLNALHYKEMYMCATQHTSSTHSTTKKCTCVQQNTPAQRTPLQRNVHVCNTTHQLNALHYKEMFMCATQHTSSTHTTTTTMKGT
jgi:hypothetical protein